MKERKIDLTEYIFNFEMGILDDEDTIVLFQELIDTGMAWTLQGHYGRTAQMLIDEGYCTPKMPEFEDIIEDEYGTYAPVCEGHGADLTQGTVYRGTICAVKGCSIEATAYYNITEEDAE